MKFSIDKQERFAVFTFNEERLNSVIAPELKTEMISLNSVGVNNVVLDLEELKFIDSSGLSAILIADRLCSNANGKLVLCNANEYVMKLIKISKLEDKLDLLPSLQEAKDFMKMEILEQEIISEAANGSSDGEE